jgi:type IV pilus assembly protein PilM
MANVLQKLLQDPPPEYVIEITEAGLAYIRPGLPHPAFRPLGRGVLSVSPVADNVMRPDAFADAVRSIMPGPPGRKRRPAVLLLPDYSARVSILEFDQFPSTPPEQLALVRFRMKKSVPFDMDTAVIGYHVQAAKLKTNVIVVAAALEIVSRYEAPFRAAGLHPGFVTTSSLAMAELAMGPAITLVARLTGQIMSVLVMQEGLVRLIRTMELSAVTPEEMLAVLLPTVAFVEDELGKQPSRVLVCGFDQDGRLPDWLHDVGIPIEPLRGRSGLVGSHDAGLMGYLESPGVAGAKRVA